MSIGWFDDDESVILDPISSYKVAREMNSDGEGFSISATTLRRRLKDQGLLVSTGRDSGRESLLVRKTIAGVQHNLLHLSAPSFQVYFGDRETDDAKY